MCWVEPHGPRACWEDWPSPGAEPWVRLRHGCLAAAGPDEEEESMKLAPALLLPLPSGNATECLRFSHRYAGILWKKFAGALNGAGNYKIITETVNYLKKAVGYIFWRFYIINTWRYVFLSCIPSSILQMVFSLLEISDRKSLELRVPTLYGDNVLPT